MKVPRLLMAAPKSGSGKTLITCALLDYLKEKGLNPVSFKCGPDYIDPMFHRTVLGISSENLDTWFTGEEGTARIMAEGAVGHGIAVTEGVMGLYDGLGGTGKEGSAHHLASVTKTPVILVVDVHGMGRSMIPLIRGFIDYDDQKLIRGVILNRMTENFYKTMKPMLDTELSVPVLGYFPVRKDMNIESRHLGLQLPMEIEGIRETLHEAAKQLGETVDMEALLSIAESAGELPDPDEDEETGNTGSGEGLTLAVARDKAFCFYYGANIRAFEKQGVKIRYFSPLEDEKIPEEADGVLFGGGYPELYTETLSDNSSMLTSVRSRIGEGLPSLAECGGFMYLHNTITDADGNTRTMCGVIDGDITFKGKLVRFGYAELQEKESVFLPAGEKIKAHEFHYYDSTDNGSCVTAVKPLVNRSWECVHEDRNHFWGFPHLYYASAPEFMNHFISEMSLYHGQK